MDENLRTEYARIGRERDEAGRVHDRHRLWFWVRVAAIAWAWVVAGVLILGQGLHINATVGQFYFPDAMDRAKLWFQAGIFVGTAGPVGTYMWAWRAASKRGYLD